MNSTTCSEKHSASRPRLSLITPGPTRTPSDNDQQLSDKTSTRHKTSPIRNYQSFHKPYNQKNLNMATSDTHTAFFYGTLMAPSVLRRVCFGPSAHLPDSTTARFKALTIKPALLPGFRRHRVVGADYPGIIENAQAEVRGTLVTGLTDGDVWRLDLFEGSEYVRRKVQVKLLRGTTTRGTSAQRAGELPPSAAQSGKDELEVEAEVEAETYVWIGGTGTLEPLEWDFDEFVRQKMWRWVDEGGEQEGEYDELDDAVNTDPTGGRGTNGDITKALEGEKVVS